MKIIKYFSIVFFVIGIQFTINGQTISGQIKYQVALLDQINNPLDTLLKDEPEALGFLEQEFKRRDQMALQLEYILKFNGNEALFYHPYRMSSDGGFNFGSALAHVGISGQYYINLSEELVLREFNFSDKKLLLKSRIKDVGWTVHKETKEIAGYPCIKATAVIDMNGMVSKEITVWFSPDLPYQFGPAGLSGLPGLILGFERRDFFIYANEISFSDQPEKINRPKKGELVTQSDYEEIVKKFLEN